MYENDDKKFWTIVVICCVVVVTGFLLFVNHAKHAGGKGEAGKDGKAAETDAKKSPPPEVKIPSADKLEKGAFVEFGRYPQDNGDTPEPIKWLVLENNGKTALLIAQKGIDAKPFHHEKKSITWKDCYLRKWLNNDFKQKAFTLEERKKIAESTITTPPNPNGMRGCGETKDKIFCLSIDEAKKYFATDSDRATRPTTYAINRGATEERGYWIWLRSPGREPDRSAYMVDVGSIGLLGTQVETTRVVRPALRLNLKDPEEKPADKNGKAEAKPAGKDAGKAAKK